MEPHYDGYAERGRDLGKFCKKVVAAAVIH